MGKEEKKLPFSIISKSKKIKQLKKLGWKGYLLFLSFFIVIGGLVAYYQVVYQPNASNDLTSGSEKYSTNKKLTLESISQSKTQTRNEEKKTNQLSKTTMESKEINKNNKTDTKNLEKNKAKQSKPQMSSKTVTSSFNNLTMPLKGKIITNCEWYKDEFLDVWKYNAGINIKADIGAKVKVAQKGTVKKLIRDDYQGLTIIVEHNEIYQTLYSNLEKSVVKAGDQVTKGQIIGKLGDSGVSASESKLHFEIIKEDKRVDPMKYF